jgi:Tol biopolymer transport system component
MRRGARRKVWGASVVLSTALAALTTLVLGQGTATAAFPGNDGRIVYTHWTSGNVIEDIHSVKKNGTGITALTSTPAVSDRDPAWNAAGTQIAFHRGDGAGTITGIWTIAADGSGLAMVPNTDGGFSAAWSPDGTQIAYVCPDPIGGDTEICTVNADGTGLTQLTATAGFEGGPAWSPDGSVIAFSRTPPAEDRSQLRTIDPDTVTEQAITPSAAGRYDSSPDWSPDGSALAFSRFDTGSGHGGAIYTIDADGSGLNLVSAPAVGLDIHHITPAWSPTGKQIVFSRADDDLAFGHLFTVKPNGKGLKQITSGRVTHIDPSWGPS